jgi:fluoride exporter
VAKYVFIVLGGGFGSLLRYLVQGWAQRVSDGTFPIGTLVVNLMGCLAIGALAAWFASPTLIREEYRVGLTVGILGGFTTFSAFGLESFMLANDSQVRAALINVVVSCGLGFAAVWAGYRVVEHLLGVAS